MLAGHLGAALAIGRAERRVNVGVFVAAALLLDVALWAFVLLGWESASIPLDYARTRQAQFVFPYTHSLFASILWSAAAGALGYALFSGSRGARWRVAALIALAVFSHWLLDALVHSPRIPLAGADSLKVGLGLWERLPIALAVEAAIVVVGLFLFVRGSGLPRARSIALVALSLAVLAFTVIGMTSAPPPPSIPAMAGSSLGLLVVVCAFAAWIGAKGAATSPRARGRRSPASAHPDRRA